MEVKMENGKWKMENGKWKMENGKWKMENGRILEMDCGGKSNTELTRNSRLQTRN